MLTKNSCILLLRVSVIFIFCMGSKNLSAQYKYDPAIFKGKWVEVTNEKRGISRSIEVKAAKNNGFLIEFRANHVARGFTNTAKGIASLKNSTIVLRPANNTACVIRLKFVDGDLIVTENGDCGWGKGITAEGHYIKLVSNEE